MVGSRCSDGLEAVPVPGFLPQLRSAGRVVSKSDTTDASRSSGLHENRGIMRFRFARFTPAKFFVSDLDIGPAVGAVSATARRRFPMRNPDRTWARHPTSLSRVAGPPACPSCAVRPGTFHAAGCSPHRAGAFDAAGDRSPVPARVRCPRLEGKVPGRAGCPRQRPGAGPGCTAELRPESDQVQARACSQARTARTRRFSSPGCRSSPRKMFATCLATAPSETTSRSAICAFDSP